MTREDLDVSIGDFGFRITPHGAVELHVMHPNGWYRVEGLGLDLASALVELTNLESAVIQAKRLVIDRQEAIAASGAKTMNPTRKGDLITCTNGHVIGEVLRDVNLGDMGWGDAFGNWRQPDHPEIGEVITAKQSHCLTCGAPFFEGGRLHFEDGWKP